MEYKKYRRKELSELREVTDSEVMSKQLSSNISLSPVDKENGSPVIGDMIARNPNNHNDEWLVAKDYFNDNLELVERISMIDKKMYTRTYKIGFDTITDIVSIKEIIEMHKNTICFTASQVATYCNHWRPEFSVKETIEAINRVPSQIKEDIDFSILTREELYNLGFGNWDGKLITIPLILWNFIPKGAVLTSIGGDTKIKDDKFDDLDARGGCIAYGFVK